jgi:hypothetical protein
LEWNCALFLISVHVGFSILFLRVHSTVVPLKVRLRSNVQSVAYKICKAANNTLEKVLLVEIKIIYEEGFYALLFIGWFISGRHHEL